MKKANSKKSEIKSHYKIWLSSKQGQGIMGDGKWQLLNSISKTGSIMAACEKLGISYRKAWGDLKRIEEIFGFAVIEKYRGGRQGGRTVLTKEGKKLLNAFEKFHFYMDIASKKSIKKFQEIWRKK